MGSAKKKSSLRRDTFAYARVLHIYISTFLFALMIFFCLTGIFLNHRWYDSQNNRLSETETELSASQLVNWGISPSATWKPDLSLITEFLRNQYGFPSPHSIDLDEELGEITVEFNVPAGFATAILDSHSALLIIEREAGSFIGILNDLHKGRHSGIAWSWIIDVSAGLMILFSITGMIILFQGKRNRRIGIWSAIAGCVSPYIIYLIFVPSVGG